MRKTLKCSITIFQIIELENDLDTEGRKSAEIVKQARKAEMKVREMQLQLEDEHKANERTQDAAEKMNAKLKKMRMQLEETVRCFGFFLLFTWTIW